MLCPRSQKAAGLSGHQVPWLPCYFLLIGLSVEPNCKRPSSAYSSRLSPCSNPKGRSIWRHNNWGREDIPDSRGKLLSASLPTLSQARAAERHPQLDGADSFSRGSAARIKYWLQGQSLGGRGERQLAWVSKYYSVGCTAENKKYTYRLTNGGTLANALQVCVTCILKKKCPDKVGTPRAQAKYAAARRYKFWGFQHLSPQIIIFFFWSIPEIPPLALPVFSFLHSLCWFWSYTTPGPAWAGLAVQVARWESVHCPTQGMTDKYSGV